MKQIKLTCTDIKKFRDFYINYYSKFIHSSYLLLEDLDKEFNYKNCKYKIVGLWDWNNKIVDILIKNVQSNLLYLLSDKIIAECLGYKKLRNLITGKEIEWVVVPNKNLVSLDSDLDQEDEFSEENQEPEAEREYDFYEEEYD